MRFVFQNVEGMAYKFSKVVHFVFFIILVLVPETDVDDVQMWHFWVKTSRGSIKYSEFRSMVIPKLQESVLDLKILSSSSLILLPDEFTGISNKCLTLLSTSWCA